MSDTDDPGTDPELEDQDAGPATQPTGAAAAEPDEDDQDAGPATSPLPPE